MHTDGLTGSFLSFKNLGLFQWEGRYLQQPHAQAAIGLEGHWGSVLHFHSDSVGPIPKMSFTSQLASTPRITEPGCLTYNHHPSQNTNPNPPKSPEGKSTVLSPCTFICLISYRIIFWVSAGSALAGITFSLEILARITAQEAKEGTFSNLWG